MATSSAGLPLPNLSLVPPLGPQAAVNAHVILLAGLEPRRFGREAA